MLRDVFYIYNHVLARYKAKVALILLVSLLAQICLLMSLLLPWQILQVLATGHSRIDFIWAASTPAVNQLIWLSIIIASSFALYLWLNKQSKALSVKLANNSLDDLNKTKLMVNHEHIAIVTMQVIVRSLSVTLNALVFSIIGLLIYAKVMLAVIAYMALIGLAIINRYQHYHQIGDIAKLQEKLQQYVLLFSNIGIAVAFLVIVYDYMHQHLPPLFTIFMVVLVLRQALVAYLNSYIMIIGVIKRRKNINTLFLPQEKKLDVKSIDKFEEQFYQDNLTKWLPSWLEGKTDKFLDKAQQQNFKIDKVDCLECVLLSRATTAYVVLEITLVTKTEADNPAIINNTPITPTPALKKWLLLKCYHPSKSSHAKHEQDLLASDLLKFNSSNFKYKTDITKKSNLTAGTLFNPSCVNIDLSTHRFFSYDKQGGKFFSHIIAPYGMIDATKAKSDTCLILKNTDISKLIPVLYDDGKLEFGNYLLMPFANIENIKWLNSAERKPYLQAIRVGMYATQLPQDLVMRFEQTHLDLVARMQEVNWQRLNYMTELERKRSQLDKLTDKWDELIKQVKRVPKALVQENLTSPRIITYNTPLTCNNQLTLYDWQGWIYDSMGVNWGLSGNIENEVAQVVSCLKAQTHCQPINANSISRYFTQFDENALIQDIVLVAKLAEFCHRLSYKNDVGAMNMIKGIFITLNKSAKLANSDE